MIWTGSDDGLIYLTRDGGKTWQNVTPPPSIMPEWIQINSIEPDPFNPGGLYVAATMYKWDDFRPYLYKTKDYGRTWQKITNGIARITLRASFGPIRSGRACSTPEPKAASTSPSTMARTGSRSSSTCRSCRSRTWPSRAPT
nr:hypothetical protein [Rhodothermus marinus]